VTKELKKRNNLAVAGCVLGGAGFLAFGAAGCSNSGQPGPVKKGVQDTPPQAQQAIQNYSGKVSPTPGSGGAGGAGAAGGSR
jgi:hypothetical protein